MGLLPLSSLNVHCSESLQYITAAIPMSAVDKLLADLWGPNFDIAASEAAVVARVEGLSAELPANRYKGLLRSRGRYHRSRYIQEVRDDLTCRFTLPALDLAEFLQPYGSLLADLMQAYEAAEQKWVLAPAAQLYHAAQDSTVRVDVDFEIWDTQARCATPIAGGEREAAIGISSFSSGKPGKLLSPVEDALLLYGAHVSQDVPEEVSGLSLMAVACGDRPPSSNGAAPAPQHAKYLLVLLFAMASRNRASFAKQPHHKVKWLRPRKDTVLWR